MSPSRRQRLLWAPARVGVVLLRLHEGFERRQFALVGLCLALVCPLLPGVGHAVSFIGHAVSVVAYRVLVCLAAVELSLTFIEFRGPSGVADLALLGVDVPVFSQVPLPVYVTSVFSWRFVAHQTILHQRRTPCHG